MIRSDGSPVADATMNLHAKGDADLLPRPETLKIDHNIKVTTDLSGAYKINHLLPGATFSGVTIDGLAREPLPFAISRAGDGGGRAAGGAADHAGDQPDQTFGRRSALCPRPDRAPGRIRISWR